LIMAKILVLGGAHIDRRGRLEGAFHEGSSHPGTWHEEAGGGAFNAARNLARFGHSVTLISPRGGDAAGEFVGEAAFAAGIIDRPFTFLDRRTPTYTAVLKSDGNLIAGLADMDLYRLFSPRRLRMRSMRDAFTSCDGILCDANLPADTLTAIAQMAHGFKKHVSAIGISPAKVTRLNQALPHLDMLFINAAEAHALTGESDLQSAIRALQASGLKAGSITNGGNALHAFNRLGTIAYQPPELGDVKDVTGAGDAFAAATLSATLNGHAPSHAIRDGVAGALITLASPNAFAPTMCADLLRSTSDALSMAHYSQF
jgi:pseudouridine kinase